MKTQYKKDHAKIFVFGETQEIKDIVTSLDEVINNVNISPELSNLFEGLENKRDLEQYNFNSLYRAYFNRNVLVYGVNQTGKDLIAYFPNLEKYFKKALKKVEEKNSSLENSL